MASCEKCWKESGGNHLKYIELVSGTMICTPEEQAGEDAEFCLECNRKTVHQWVHKCVICNR